MYCHNVPYSYVDCRHQQFCLWCEDFRLEDFGCCLSQTTTENPCLCPGSGNSRGNALNASPNSSSNSTNSEINIIIAVSCIACIVGVLAACIRRFVIVNDDRSQSYAAPQILQTYPTAAQAYPMQGGPAPFPYGYQLHATGLPSAAVPSFYAQPGAAGYMEPPVARAPLACVL